MSLSSANLSDRNVTISPPTPEKYNAAAAAPVIAASIRPAGETIKTNAAPIAVKTAATADPIATTPPIATPSAAAAPPIAISPATTPAPIAAHCAMVTISSSFSLIQVETVLIVSTMVSPREISIGASAAPILFCRAPSTAHN